MKIKIYRILPAQCSDVTGAIPVRAVDQFGAAIQNTDGSERHWPSRYAAKKAIRLMGHEVQGSEVQDQ